MEAKATETVLEQARMMANGFAKSRTYEIPDNTNISLAAEPD
jgi:type I restriction enzyme R subunit